MTIRQEALPLAAVTPTHYIMATPLLLLDTPLLYTHNPNTSIGDDLTQHKCLKKIN